jgi:hypothetical protein
LCELAQVHPKCSIEEQEELSALLQIPLVAGTINRGMFFSVMQFLSWFCFFNSIFLIQVRL